MRIMIKDIFLLIVIVFGPFFLLWAAIGMVKMYKQHKAWESEDEESLTIE